MTEDYARPTRIAGALLTLCAIGALILVTLHPGGSGKTFAEMLRAEAVARTLNGVVHGGFVALLSVELAALAVLALSTRWPAIVAGLTLFALGVVALSGSLLIDGLALPAVAVKYLAMPDKLEFARSLFTLCAAFIGVLMPAGLMLQAGGVLFFGIGLTHAAQTRVSGVLGIVIGAIAVLGVGLTGLQPIVVMATMATLSLWLAWFGVLALRARL